MLFFLFFFFPETVPSPATIKKTPINSVELIVKKKQSTPKPYEYASRLQKQPFWNTTMPLSFL